MNIKESASCLHYCNKVVDISPAVKDKAVDVISKSGYQTQRKAGKPVYLVGKVGENSSKFMWQS